MTAHIDQEERRGCDAAFALRARLLSPRSDGSRLMDEDGIVEVGGDGRIAWIGRAQDYRGSLQVQDLRPIVLLPGLIDLHAHLPQVPITGGGGPEALETRLREQMEPVERAFTGDGTAALAGSYLRRFAAAGTTTAVLYGAVDADSTDVAFQAAARLGLRVVLGQCLMDRRRYDDAPEAGITERRLAESAALCERWDGHDDGRLRYAFTPRYALSATDALLRESAALAADRGAFWQTHLSEDPAEVALVAKEFPTARDYVDVYDRAGALGARTLLAHAVHLSARERRRLRETGSHIAHCPSNVFGAGGLLDVGRYRQEGLSLGLASDVGACSDISMFTAMQIGWMCQRVRRKLVGAATIDELWSWLELATIAGARCLGAEDRLGSLEVGKEFDAIALNARLTMLIADQDPPLERVLHLAVFRSNPMMVRRGWVRGRELAGPPDGPDRHTAGDAPTVIGAKAEASPTCSPPREPSSSGAPERSPWQAVSAAP